MVNIFSDGSVQLYGAAWNVVEERAFTAEEQNMVESAVVVASEYSNSVCFHMKGSGKTYIPVSTQCESNVGDSVDISKVKLLKLHREGEKDIMRIQL